MLPLLACGPATTFITPDTGVQDEDSPAETLDDAPEDTGEERDTAEEAVERAYEAFFDRDVIQEVRLTIPEEGIDDLRREPLTQVAGGVEVNGEVFDDVGVRLKGSGTFQTIDGKAAFKVELDAYEPGLRYAGLERLTLNNMTNDATQSKEVLDYNLWNDAGMLAPRTNYAKVWVNEEYWGLYVNIESMDDHWLKRRYEQDGGDLWEANDSSDFTRQGLSHWELISGAGDTEALAAVSAAIQSFDGDAYASLDELLDMDEFLAYWAWNLAVANVDGYPYTLNDLFIYDDPSDGRFDFIPWGMDEAWYIWLEWTYVSGSVAQVCLQDPDCITGLGEAVDAALAVYEDSDVSGRALAAWDLSQEAMLDDPRRPWTPVEVEAARAELETILPQWPDMLRAEIP